MSVRVQTLEERFYRDKEIVETSKGVFSEEDFCWQGDPEIQRKCFSS